MSDPATHFSNDYKEARAKFLEAARDASATIDHHVLEGYTGPDGEELAMDIATLGPADSRAALVVLSATHGVEGFCGSGCQTGFLREDVLRGLSSQLRILLVHAHNPYGFAWLRRVNEENIDLNRNYVDHASPPAQSPDYEQLKDAIAPKAMSGPAFEEANARLRAYAEKHGAFALQATMTRGQYDHADGLFYGGKAPAWSNRTLCGELSRLLTHQRRVAVIDFHTGLGPFGHGEIISEFEPNSPGEARMIKWFGEEAKSMRRGESVSADLVGTVDAWIPRVLSAAEVTAFALEYGTVKSDDVLEATRADNWLHLHGDLDSPQGKAIKTEIRRVFYPDTDEWKRLVWSRAVNVVMHAARGVLEENE